jgi:kynurenine formamidase
VKTLDRLRLVLAVALWPVAAVAAGPKAPDLATATIVDLTHPFDEDTIYWPNSPLEFELKTLAYGDTPAGYFYSAYSLCMPEHGGTHLDAPIHFSRTGRTVDQVPLRQLIAKAAVIDVSKKAQADADYRLTAEDVIAWEKIHGVIAAGTILLLRTGWSERWPDKKRYLGDDTKGDTSRLHFPSYGAAAAELLVHKRKVAALGIDTASIDHGPSQDFVVHRIALGAQVPGLENLANLEQMPETGAWIIALPMKIAGGSGSPLRVVALLPH